MFSEEEEEKRIESLSTEQAKAILTSQRWLPG